MQVIKKGVRCIWGATLFLCGAHVQADRPVQAIDDVRVFAIYEPVLSQNDVELLSRARPDFICRGWFKWHNTPDWKAFSPLAQACREKGIRLQGGITVSALYPGENGIDDATFRDFACHGTDGRPYLCRHSDSEGWYHLSLYNPKVVDMLKREARLQIDAGACGIWYDEIEGYYDWNPTEGYDLYACAAFRDWLIQKYVIGCGWSENDPRWQRQFGIDLAMHGGSIRTFDYMRHLQNTNGKDGKPLATNPPQGNPRAWTTSSNPLYREWGYAWDRKAQGTFRFDTVAAIFADIVADADRYALEKYGRKLINTYNHNGTARAGVAFLQPHNGAQPPLRNGRLDGRVSYLAHYERVVRDAAEVCPGQPVVFFVDWPGETDRLTAMTRADQVHFFATYIPEAYAAGGEFALPLRGYSYVAAQQGTLAPLARMIDFYREYAPFLRGSRAAPQQPETIDRLTLRVRDSASGTTVHVINHAFSTRDVWPHPCTNRFVSIDWNGPAPSSAFAVSPDFPEQRPVALNLKDGRLTLDIGTVTCSALVLIPNGKALRRITGTATAGTHIFAVSGHALTLARNGRFELWISPDTDEVECLETGERQIARDGVSFAAPPPGEFTTGLLSDYFGIPARHAELTSGTRRFHTDTWGRFRIPRSQVLENILHACVERGATNSLAVNELFAAWRTSAERRSIGDFASSMNGYWANWPDKDHTPAVITLSREEHAETSALRCVFAPMPHVPWSNINSPVFQTTDASGIEVVYAGDGTPRTVNAVLYTRSSFYRFPLSLAAKGWTRQRIGFHEFRDDRGTPLGPAAITGNVSFQLSAPKLDQTPITVWLHSVSLVNDLPVRSLWQSKASFDDVDVDNLYAEHQPLPQPPAMASRQPLVRFNAPQKTLANWAGKNLSDTKPMVIIERLEPTGDRPFLRITFPVGACEWGNANIPLPTAHIWGQHGLALRLRAKNASDTLALSLHAALQDGKQSFYHADCEAGEDWTAVALPWSEFHRDDGKPFAPEGLTWVNLQVTCPREPLEKDAVVEIEQIDCFTARQ